MFAAHAGKTIEPGIVTLPKTARNEGNSLSAAPLLRMHEIAKRFGATHALRDVSLEVHGGEVLALIGENGAGKSTLMKVLSGAYRPDAGRMELAGRSFAPSGPYAARAAGVAMIYQELNLALDMSVEDNIMLGQERQRYGLLDRRAQRRRVGEVLNLLGHPELRPESRVAGLSVGALQLVEIARALIHEAQVIVFDEPTSSLSQRDVDRLFSVIARLKQTGMGVVYISHFLEELRLVADRYTVLRDGQVAGAGRLADATESQLIALMVGRSVEELFPQAAHQPGEVLLSLAGLSGRKRPADVSFELRRGEILGIAGLIGAGRTELLRCLFALDPIRSGQVRVGGITPAASPRKRIRAGLGLVSEDRKGEGLALGRSIADNLTCSHWQPYSRWGWLRLGRRRAAVAQWMHRLRIKARSPEQAVADLSGGNQQKVAIARLLHQQADVLLLDEPTRGIDVATKAEIYRLMGEQAASGKAIVFVSSYFRELLAVCDRVGVMTRGRLREIRPARNWTEESLMACAVGVESEAS